MPYIYILVELRTLQFISYYVRLVANRQCYLSTAHAEPVLCDDSRPRLRAYFARAQSRCVIVIVCIELLFN